MAVLNKDLILYGENFSNKDDLFQRIAETAIENKIIENKEEFMKGLYDREKEFSTCFGNGIAIPHCRSTCIHEASVIIIKAANEIDWGDGQTANIIICLAVPEDTGDTHIKLLSSVARKLVHEDFVAQLKSADSIDAIYDCFAQYKGNDE